VEKPEQSGPAGAPRSRMAVLVPTLLALVVAGCSHAPAAPQRHRLDGSYIVHGIFSHRGYGRPCNPADAGYPDIRAGTTVTVRDGTGAVLGTTALAGGTLRKGALGGREDDCFFSFSLTVPVVDSYRVEVERRGGVKFSRADLERSNWRADLTIGAYTMFGGD
jgi:hypothetical protein